MLFRGLCVLVEGATGGRDLKKGGATLLFIGRPRTQPRSASGSSF